VAAIVSHPQATHRTQMDALKLRYRHQPPRVHPHWMLLIAAVASLAMLVLASMLAGPGSLPLR
jgi:hypothetical protein